MNDLVERARAAASWVAGQQSEDGSFEPLDAGVTPYYKAAACLATAGETAAAARLARWVRSEVITTEGDFESASHPRDRGMALFWPYPNAWLVNGFVRLGAWDLAHKGACYLASIQDPATGAFSKQPGADVDLFPTANAGLACLSAGVHEAAHRAAALVRRAIEEQPDLDAGIYTVWRPGGIGGEQPSRAQGDDGAGDAPGAELRTPDSDGGIGGEQPSRAQGDDGVGDAPGAELRTPDSDGEPGGAGGEQPSPGGLATEFKESHGWRYFLANEPRRQMTFIPGMCATFLVRHALAAASDASMARAKDWVMAACRNEPHIYEWPETGKVGWAAALHHGATGDPETRRVAERVRDFLSDTQADDGSWPRDTQADTLDVTAEFSVILAEMAAGLA